MKGGASMGGFHNRKFLNLTYSHAYSEAPKQSSFERHCHDTFEVLYVLRGAGKYVVEGVEYPLRPQTLLLTRPYEFHYVCPDAGTEYDRYVINFNLSALVDSAAFLSILKSGSGAGHGVYFPAGSISDTALSVFDELDLACEMFDGSSHRASREETMFRANLTRLLFFLSRAKPETVSSGEENVVTRVIDHLNRNLTDELSLDALSQQFFVSKYYLCHAFRRQTGVSIFAYVNTKRIAMAQQLLANGEPATSVAYAVGYGTYSSFYRAFCKQTGHPPAHKR
jgi:AraC-like DNA-binding protein